MSFFSTYFGKWNIFLPFIFLILIPLTCHSFPEQGKWVLSVTNTNRTLGVFKSIYANTSIYLNINCASVLEQNITLRWVIRETKCWDEYAQLEYMTADEKLQMILTYLNHPDITPSIPNYPSALRIAPDETYEHRCDNSISLPYYQIKDSALVSENKSIAKVPHDNSTGSFVRHEKTPLFTVPSDGIYLLIIDIEPLANSINGENSFSAEVTIEMKSADGYLSAVDWPLLPFYGSMCLVYVVYGTVWLIFLFSQWKDILRIQFWIGGVILLGMFEMALFYAEYQSINSNGTSVSGALIFAEIVSCAKRTLARLLIVIVSIGFGIVKPRLGDTLHKLVIVGGMYFTLASIESTLRIIHPVNGPSNRAVMAGLGLSIMDGFICYWIFHSLLSTTRTLRLRRNLVKLALFRSFTNALIFAVIASVGFMIWSIRFINSPVCLKDWKEIWANEAFWHFEFSLILLVIMILWRPTNNNQRYSFTPLSENPDDDEEEDLVINEAFGSNMKLRPKQVGSEKINKYRNQNVDDELKWVEENLPTDFGEGDLPALDSEEEILTSKFELSKMQ